jgi:beta-glucosidase
VKFPKDFVWGTATASYQIEGAVSEDGRGVSIWDTFSRTPGKVFEGHTGDTACDHYHRYQEDIQLMKELGIQSYRFSIAWPRIFPDRGRFNQKGIDFYKRLVDELLQNDIKPAATMYHWDLPQYLQDKGGWVNRDTVNYFQDYAETLYRELGDVIPAWITHNEPWCAAFLSYGLGIHAPGHQDWKEAIRASHHILLSHGKAVEAFRTSGLKGEIGITLNLNHVYPEAGSKEDLEAAYRVDGFSNRWFLDPIFKGEYPKDMMELFARHVGPDDFIKQGDLETISRKIDFLGVNYYTRALVKNGPEDGLLSVENLRGTDDRTDMGWEVYPQGLYDLLTRIKKDYGDIPLYITENGAAYPDSVVNGTVDDQKRIDYIEAHLEKSLQFINEGGNLKGYYVWSFMDNFEWSFGYSKRFGIVYVDYETQQRIPKKSSHWYRDLIKNSEHF